MRWYTSPIVSGNKIGRAIGFPTFNLKNVSCLSKRKKGVWATRVEIKNKIFPGVLYYGPRTVLGEKNDVIEIHLLNPIPKSKGKIETISWCLVSYIRKVKKFSGLEEMKRQIEIDTEQAKNVLSNIDPLCYNKSLFENSLSRQNCSRSSENHEA